LFPSNRPSIRDVSTVLLVLGIVGLVALHPAVVAAGTTSANPVGTRSTNATEVAPGNSITVSITVEVPESEDRMAIQESFEPDVSNVAIESVDAGNATVITTLANDGGVTTALADVPAGTEVTLTYVVRVPADVSTEPIRFTGQMIEDGNRTEIGGDDVVQVASGEPTDGGTTSGATPTATATPGGTSTTTATATATNSGDGSDGGDDSQSQPGFTILGTVVVFLAGIVYLVRRRE